MKAIASAAKPTPEQRRTASGCPTVRSGDDGAGPDARPRAPSARRATRPGRCARWPAGCAGWRRSSPRPFAASRAVGADAASLSGRACTGPPAARRPSGRPAATLPGVTAAPAESPSRATGRDPGRDPAPGRARRARAAGVEAGRRSVEGALAELRAAWPGLEPGDRRLLGRLVTGLLDRHGPAGPRPRRPGEPLAAVLARLGVRRLRPGQDRAIAAGLAGRDALVVMATGSGKSLCYQAPAAALSGPHRRRVAR